MKVSTIGLDTAKNVFQLHGTDDTGHEVLRRQLRRGEMLRFFGRLEPCLIGLEAGCAAHHWARELIALGHDVRLLPPRDVRPYVTRGKTDAVDAAAICEAVTRPSMRVVPVKSAAQQARLVEHRVRTALVRQRTRLINLLRSQLAEFGLVAARGRHRFGALCDLLDDDGLPPPARPALMLLVKQIVTLDDSLRRCDKAIVAAVRNDPAARRLMAIPGVGPIIASAMVATVDDPGRFRCGRHFAAWLGLVPRQHSSGGKPRPGPISKMGDRYLRQLLVVGATASMRAAGQATTPLAAWIRRLLERRPPRLVSVALANKIARIIWAVLARGQTYRPAAAAA